MLIEAQSGKGSSEAHIFRTFEEWQHVEDSYE